MASRSCLRPQRLRVVRPTAKISNVFGTAVSHSGYGVPRNRFVARGSYSPYLQFLSIRPGLCDPSPLNSPFSAWGSVRSCSSAPYFVYKRVYTMALWQHRTLPRGPHVASMNRVWATRSEWSKSGVIALKCSPRRLRSEHIGPWTFPERTYHNCGGDITCRTGTRPLHQYPNAEVLTSRLISPPRAVPLD
jgi:hypothetical protein